MTFKNEYLIGVGWPQKMTCLDFEGVAMYPTQDADYPLMVEIPIEMYDDDCPRYELVLRRAKE